MNTNNPYAIPQSNYSSNSPDGPRRISIGTFEAFRRGYQLLGDQYWLFMGVCLVGIIIGSLVPMGIIMGPMIVGIFFCVIDREQGRRFDFNTLFRGFDRFADSLIAMIIMVITSFVLLIPIVILFMVVLFSTMDKNGQPNGGVVLGSFLVYFFMIFAASLAAHLPFSLCFQLIADRKLPAMDAVKLSFRGVWHNLGPILLFSLTGGAISFCLALMCYVPVFFFMPIWFSAAFVMYREVFPEVVVDAQIK